jgi:alpha,alpha-trehalase
VVTNFHDPSREEWENLDNAVRTWWQQDLITATEDTIRSEKEALTLFLPHPYLRISPGLKGSYRWQFPYDAAFMNCALLVHDRADIARGHILNHLSLIDRFGFVPNANVRALQTRSQTPFFMPPMIWRYYGATRDVDLLLRAYPLLKHEYNAYWKAAHHQTPIGLATNRDLGDPYLSPELASEAEVLDWMPVFGGDVRRCAPLATNSGLVGHARVLALIASELGRTAEALTFSAEAEERARLMSQYCWNEEKGIFLEYDFVAGKQLPYVSEYAYWPLWSGVASRRQGERLAQNLNLLEKPHGIAGTDKHYDDPHSDSAYEIKNSAAPYRRLQDAPPMADAPPEYIGGKEQLMWAYPAGWASTQLIVTAGLDKYGHTESARRVSSRYLSLLMDQYNKTGQLWEKYNVVDGTLVLPNARYGNIPYHSYSAAAVVLLGRRVFENQPMIIL